MSKKLCSLVKKDLPKEEPKEFIKLVKDGKYYCKKCGRVANKEKNVCKAMKLENGH